MNKSKLITAISLIASSSTVYATTFTDNVIMQQSACVGFDCISGENFGSDTIRLKENNLRIHFDDTSTSASFPNNDWRIVINDTSNGGANYFGIVDATANNRPFTVEAGARGNALVIDSSGKIGFGTPAPATSLHTRICDTPTLRLEQDGSSGFTPQTWDVAGNETSFFIRDATHGSTLPLRIRPGAPSNSLVIDTDGDVGIGTLTSDNALHVKKSAAAGTSIDMLKLEVINGGSPAIVYKNTADNVEWKERMDLQNDFQISKEGTGRIELELQGDGDLNIAGDVTANGVLLTSSRTTKTNFGDIDVNEILKRVAAIPVSQWVYKERKDVKHIGPMAEDFASAFGLPDTRHISLIDANGIALAAIQGLNNRVQEKENELAALRQEGETKLQLLRDENAQLNERISRLEAAITSIRED